MANKGERKKQKRISQEKHVRIKRKEFAWTIRTISGGYRKDEAIALGIVLREVIGKAKNLREVKAMLQKGIVKIDGKTRRDYRLPIGLFSVIDLEEETYRLIVDQKGRFIVEKIKKTDEKIIEVYSKKKIKEGKINLKFNDGTNIVVEKTALKVGDCVLYDFANGKIKEEIPFEKNSIVYIYKGVNSGKIGKIKEIIESNQKKKKIITLQIGEKEIQTIKDKVIVIGKTKPVLEIGEKK